MHRAVRKSNSPGDTSISLGTLLCGSLTLALWLAVSVVGWLGGMMKYPSATIPPRPQPPVAVQDLKIELAADSSPTVASATPAPDAESIEPPPALPLPSPPLALPPALASEVREPPPLMDLITPSPAVAFAVPVKEPPQVESVPSPATSPMAQTPAPQVSRPGGTGGVGTPRPLTIGIGEGRQPRPMYPREAERAGQQGRVTVRLTVGENGRVVSAEAAEPSPFPLLNEAALKTVRDRWRFSPGEVRVYQVAIVFRLDE